MTKECYQIGFLNWKFIEELSLAGLSFQKTYLASFLAFHSQIHSQNDATKELSQGRCLTSQKQQTSPEMLIRY